MRISILSASVWEMRRTVAALGLLSVDKKTFEGGTGKHEVRLRLTGMGEESSREAAKTAGQSPLDLVLAAGFAGSLRGDIHPGDIVLDIARSDSKLADALADASEKLGIPCHKGTFYSSGRILMKSDEKKKLGEKSGAIAVEMESQAIFEAFSGKKIPLLFARAVSDGMDQNLPDLSGILGGNGELRVASLLKLIARPSQWADFIRLVRGSSKAGRNLARVLKEFIAHV